MQIDNGGCLIQFALEPPKKAEASLIPRSRLYSANPAPGLCWIKGYDMNLTRLLYRIVEYSASNESDPSNNGGRAWERNVSNFRPMPD